MDVEECSSEDINNLEEVETVIYTPNVEDEELECSDEVYDVLDYYDLDWPSQTVASFGLNSVVVATNPDTTQSKKEAPFLKLIDLDKLDTQNAKTDLPYNRVRTNNLISCVSDTTFDVYDSTLRRVDSLTFEGVGYGLCCSDEGSIFSLTSGVVNIYTDSLKIHTDSIESLNINGPLLYSASRDKSARVTDLRSRDLVFSKTEDAEINAIDTNKDNLLAYGDDNGSIKVVDMRMPTQEIGIYWHKSSISMLTWKDSDTFVSASDEQVCLFDTSLEDDWEYEKYLLFVHQGQKYYKDLCFSKKDRDTIITTSVVGLCMFKPLSFQE